MGYTWMTALKIDPIQTLIIAGDDALVYFVRRDLLENDPGPVENLWNLPEAQQIVRKQRDDGAWPYPSQGSAVEIGTNYDLIQTYRTLRVLVEMYGVDRSHPALARAAEYIFSCQTEEGDIRGCIGNQYMPYYHGAILELLIKAGYDEDARVLKGLDWLLDMRQDDGGWIIPMMTVPSAERTDEMWRGDPLPPDRSKPFAHMATGMAIRALAAHLHYCHREETRLAGDRLKERFFKPDKYNDRKAAHYWLKFQYPFWWSSLLTALDSLGRIGFSREDEDVKRGLDWFMANQAQDGLWETGYDKGKQAAQNRLWVGLAVCRMLKRFYDERV